MPEQTDYDIVLSWTSAEAAADVFYKFRLARGEGSYEERSIRSEISQQALTQSENPAFQSRPDVVTMYQSSWTDGAQWWKPLNAINSYFQGNHMDTWSEPGKVVPMNKVADAANTVLHDACVIGVGAGGDLFGIGATDDTTTSILDVLKWTPASNAFVVESGYASGIASTSAPMAMTFDPTDGYFYVISDDDDIERFSPASSTSDPDYITTGFTSYLGANIFMHRTDLMFYSGDQVYTVDKASTDVEAVFNDGMGPEFLSGASFASTNQVFLETNPKLAVSTPEGVFYVKNVRMGGQPQAWVWRVNKNDAGQWIGDPLAPLPIGSVALSIAYHLGSIVIAATPDWNTALVNDDDELEIELYHYTGGQPGALGVVLGRDTLDETPFALLGSSGSLLYIGGHKRLWVYDAIRGGLHTAFEWGTGTTEGPYHAMAWVADSAGDSAMIFLGQDRIARQKRASVADPDTVSSFGDDLTHYALESSYFDANLPMEVKRIAKVEALFDAAVADSSGNPQQRWSVQVSVDDAAFTSAINTDTGALVGYASVGTVDPRGRIFRYKFIYQTKTAVKNALRAVAVAFSTGEIIREWELLLDLSETRNLRNQLVKEEDVIADLRFFAEDTNEDIVSFLDNYKQDKSADISDLTSNYVKVKLQSISILKEKPTEALARIVLREDPFSTITTV